jgi:prolyl 4-hydroxylase
MPETAPDPAPIDPNADPAKLSVIGVHVTKRLSRHPDVIPVDIADAQIYVYQQFLDARDCALLIGKIDAAAVPSTLYKGTEQPGFRTSYSCHLHHIDPDVSRIEARMSQVLGIHNDYAETMQGQRYHAGQEFKAHHDFFHTSQSYWQKERDSGGQRTWTAMIFLNVPEEGGATEFRHLGIGIRPEMGTMIIWNNMKLDGTPNHKTLHAGTPVKAGVKHIITKWYRQNNWKAVNRPER